MAWKGEVQTDGTGKWYSNGLLFKGQSEASMYIIDLMMRWTAVRDTRVVEVDAPATYAWTAAGAVRLPEPAADDASKDMD